MNAVERLLGHAEQALNFFDDVFRDRLGSAANYPDGVCRGKLHMLANAAIDRLDKLRGWDSSLAMFAACERVLLRHPPSKRPDLALGIGGKQVAEEYFLMTAERGRLLDTNGLVAMLGDVVAGSSAWGSLAERTVVLAETVVDALKRVRRLESELDPDDWTNERVRLREALDALLPYSQPPAQAAIPEKRTGSSGRPPAGGRPKKYSASLRREIIADRKREERKKNPESLKTWITSWATRHGMKRADALKMYNAEMAAIRRAQQARSR